MDNNSTQKIKKNAFYTFENKLKLYWRKDIHKSFVKKVNYDIENLFHSNRRLTPNMTAGEREAIHWLKNNRDLVIRQADKGGATVVWGKSLYIQEAFRQLHKATYYTPLSLKPKV